MRPCFHKRFARRAGWLAAIVLVATQSASADDHDRLAPPGPCAEPREAVSGAPVPGSSSPLAVVGPLQQFFNPNDVAAPPAAPERAAPTGLAAARRPGACETPSSGCITFEPAGNPPVVPGTRPGSYDPLPKVLGNPPVLPGARP